MSQLPIISHIINLKHIESRLYFMYHVQILTHLCLYTCYYGWVDVCLKIFSQLSLSGSVFVVMGQVIFILSHNASRSFEIDNLDDYLVIILTFL